MLYKRQNLVIGRLSDIKESVLFDELSLLVSFNGLFILNLKLILQIVAPAFATVALRSAVGFILSDVSKNKQRNLLWLCIN